MKTERQILSNTHVQGEILPEMDEQQFRQWVDLIEERTGKVFPPTRKSFLITNLVMRMKEIGCASYQKYYEQIKCGINGLKEWTMLVDRIIVNETRFFRYPSSLELVKEAVESKLPGEDGSVSIQAWSVACSTGEEAYTLAIVIDQALAARNEVSHF
ncbi:MAG: protein-glutamate O-methyltransferase CheR, partial [Gammaproteobacteria bacterium]|nr:protein-glutamate O-methyltransferase CheR [Gammaproteobacteria bacterium]